MASITLESKLDSSGSLSIPKETLEAIGIFAGDEIKIQIESSQWSHSADQTDQHEMHRRAKMLFEEADSIVRDPIKPSLDPLEAAWGNAIEEKARRMGIKV